MKVIYTFTDDERRVIQAAAQPYFQRLQFIAELHQLQGKVAVAEDLSGFTGSDDAETPNAG